AEFDGIAAELGPVHTGEEPNPGTGAERGGLGQNGPDGGATGAGLERPTVGLDIAAAVGTVVDAGGLPAELKRVIALVAEDPALGLENWNGFAGEAFGEDGLTRGRGDQKGQRASCEDFHGGGGAAGKERVRKL